MGARGRLPQHRVLRSAPAMRVGRRCRRRWATGVRAGPRGRAGATRPTARGRRGRGSSGCPRRGSRQGPSCRRWSASLRPRSRTAVACWRPTSSSRRTCGRSLRRGAASRSRPCRPPASPRRSTRRTDVVAFSAAHSATGEVADLDAVIAAAEHHGALTVCDGTQAVGWLPVDAARLDVADLQRLQVAAVAARLGVHERAARHCWTGCCRRPRAGSRAPTSTARTTACRCGWRTTRGGSTSARPGSPGSGRRLRWSCWERSASTRSTPMTSRSPTACAPAWAWSQAIRRSSAPTCPDAAARLAGSEVRAATRAGALRASFHLYNTEADVDRVLELLA